MLKLHKYKLSMLLNLLLHGTKHKVQSQRIRMVRNGDQSEADNTGGAWSFAKKDLVKLEHYQPTQVQSGRR